MVFLTSDLFCFNNLERSSIATCSDVVPLTFTGLNWHKRSLNYILFDSLTELHFDQTKEAAYWWSNIFPSCTAEQTFLRKPSNHNQLSNTCTVWMLCIESIVPFDLHSWYLCLPDAQNFKKFLHPFVWIFMGQMFEVAF